MRPGYICFFVSPVYSGHFRNSAHSSLVSKSNINSTKYGYKPV